MQKFYKTFKNALQTKTNNTAAMFFHTGFNATAYKIPLVQLRHCMRAEPQLTSCCSLPALQGGKWAGKARHPHDRDHSALPSRTHHLRSRSHKQEMMLVSNGEGADDSPTARVCASACVCVCVLVCFFIFKICLRRNMSNPNPNLNPSH